MRKEFGNMRKLLGLSLLVAMLFLVPTAPAAPWGGPQPTPPCLPGDC